MVSIHAPRAGRDLVLMVGWRNYGMVSIHAPRAGRDDVMAVKTLQVTQFQSTRPARGATLPRADCNSFRVVSIHAPRAGRDKLP